jgi:predicted nucleotide-binding protein
MTDEKSTAMRRKLLQAIYDKYMESPTAQIGSDEKDTDPDFAIRSREARWLHDHGYIAAQFGAAGDFMARLTGKGRDFVEEGGFDRGESPTPAVQQATKSIPMQKQKPRIFIGSSVEGLTIAEHVQLGLDHQAECTVWSQGVFGLSSGTLDGLLQARKNYEFAVLILTPDDLVHKRDDQKNSPRDNVLFELGLFMGALGRERTYIVFCRDDKPDLPTDLAGVTAATFAKRNDGNLEAALGPVCTQIKKAIKAAQTSNP